jgi:radical SAM protein with 4Fe4S-binding SPASM domain
MINCTIGPDNVEQLHDLVDFAADHKLQAINFGQSIPEDYWLSNQKQIMKYLSKAESRAKARRLFMESPHRYKCLIWDDVIPYINLRGDLSPCCMVLNKNCCVGNILENSFDEIWNGPQYREFREGSLCRQCYMYNMNSDQSIQQKESECANEKS